MGNALISRLIKGTPISVVQETGNSTTSVMSQKACTDDFSLKMHEHSVSDLNSGTLSIPMGGIGQNYLTSGEILFGNGINGIISASTLPIDRGGTGATSAPVALSNLGVTISSDTWTPYLSSRSGTDPAYSISYNYAKYYKINDLIYVAFHARVDITNAGSDYACIRGLPFTSTNGVGGQALALYEAYGGLTLVPATAHIADSSSQINIQNSGG